MLLLFPSPTPKMRKVRVRESEPSTQGSRSHMKSLRAAWLFSFYHALILPPGRGSDCEGEPYTLLPVEFEQGKLLAPTGRAVYWQDTTNNPLNTQGQKINTRQHLVVRQEAKTKEKPGWRPAVLDRGCFARPTMDLLLYFIFIFYIF